MTPLTHTHCHTHMLPAEQQPAGACAHARASMHVCTLVQECYHHTQKRHSACRASTPHKKKKRHNPPPPPPPTAAAAAAPPPSVAIQSISGGLRLLRALEALCKPVADAKLRQGNRLCRLGVDTQQRHYRLGDYPQ